MMLDQWKVVVNWRNDSVYYKLIATENEKCVDDSTSTHLRRRALAM